MQFIVIYTYTESPALFIEQREESDGSAEEEIQHRSIVFVRNLETLQTLSRILHLLMFGENRYDKQSVSLSLPSLVSMQVSPVWTKILVYNHNSVQKWDVLSSITRVIRQA